MNQKRINPTRLLCSVALCIICSLWGCGTVPVDPKKSPDMQDRKILLVLHFKDMTKQYGDNASFICQLCGGSFTTGTVTDGAADTLTDYMVSLLTIHTDYRLIAQGQADGALANVLSDGKGEPSELALMVQTGRSFGADAVLAGRLYRFRERVGTAYSVDSAASVGFDIDLVGVADGRLLWSGHFDETQRSLFENLYELKTFFKRKGRWLTAEELAASGLENIINRMPKP